MYGYIDLNYLLVDFCNVLRLISAKIPLIHLAKRKRKKNWERAWELKRVMMISVNLL